jgi:hypothetical protein
MKFKGEYYDVGTIARIKGPYGPVLARFVGWRYGDTGCFELIDDKAFGLYDTYNRAGVMDYCLEIVVPVKPNLQQTEAPAEKGGLPERDKPPSWDIEVAWIWYIVIMAVAVIFKDRLMIWAFVSAVFFLWKNGFLNNKKK